MKLLQPIDVARYAPRLWWLSLAAIAARFTAERVTSRAIGGFLFGLAILLVCELIRQLLRRGQRAELRAGRAGMVIAVLGIALGLTRLSDADWLSTLLTALLAIQVGAYVAAARRVHVWLILAAGFTVVVAAAAETLSPLFLPCAAVFTFMALNLLTLDVRDQRERIAAFEPMNTVERRSGGLLFSGVTLLLAIPIYLFVPKPAWLEDEPTAQGGVYREALPGAALPSPPLPEESAAPEPEQALDDVPRSLPENLIELSAHVARPESGDYGDDFGITDVQRREAIGNNVVLYARSTHAVNLRGRVFDRFANDRWSRSATVAQRVELEGVTLRVFAPPAGPTRVEQVVELAANLDTTLVHAPGIEQLSFPANTLLRYDDGVLAASEPLRAGTLYSTNSRLTLRAGRYLLREELPPDLAPYLQADGVSPRVRELAARVTSGAEDTLAKAVALEQHLRTNYAYSYETIPQQNYTPLDWFLFEGKRGHCEFFASALAMMLRAVGVPARVATGFALGDPNPITGFHEVRALDGHAWVEAYLDGEGWLMLEPTPFYPLPQSDVDRQIAEQMDGYLDRLATTRSLLEPGTWSTRATVLTRDAWRALRVGLGAVTNAMRTMGWGLPLVIIAILGGLLGGYLLWVAAKDLLDNLQIRRELAGLAGHDERGATLLVAAALQRAMTPRSLLRRPDWTLREYADELTRAASARQGAAVAIPDEFIEAFDAARYSPTAGGITFGSLLSVINLVQERLSSDPLPRLRAAVSRLRERWRWYGVRMLPWRR